MTLDHHLLHSTLHHCGPQRVPLDRLAVGKKTLWVPSPALCLHEACWWHLQLVRGAPAPQEGVYWHHPALAGTVTTIILQESWRPSQFFFPAELWLSPSASLLPANGKYQVDSLASIRIGLRHVQLTSGPQPRTCQRLGKVAWFFYPTLSPSPLPPKPF